MGRSCRRRRLGQFPGVVGRTLCPNPGFPRQAHFCAGPARRVLAARGPLGWSGGGIPASPRGRRGGPLAGEDVVADANTFCGSTARFTASLHGVSAPGEATRARKCSRSLPTPWWCESEPPRAQDLVARCALELGEHLARALDALVVEAEVEVDADAGRRRAASRAAMTNGRAGQAERAACSSPTPVLHVLAQTSWHAAPRHRRLEGLGDDAVVDHEVADVGDGEGELVAALAVARAPPWMPPCRARDGDRPPLLQRRPLPSCPRRRSCRRPCVCGSKPLTLRHVELLEPALQRRAAGRARA